MLTYAMYRFYSGAMQNEFRGMDGRYATRVFDSENAAKITGWYEFVLSVRKANGWPYSYWRCPVCGAEIPDDNREPVGGLCKWLGSCYDTGGTGWMAVRCDYCGNHFAMDTST